MELNNMTETKYWLVEKVSVPEEKKAELNSTVRVRPLVRKLHCFVQVSVDYFSRILYTLYGG